MRRTRIRAVSSRERARKQLDALLRMHVLHRAGGRCEKCGAVGGAPTASREGFVRLQVAHFKSRRVESTRWDVDNVACLCKGCHFKWAHHEPDQFTAWWRERIGDARIARLNLIWRTPRKPDLAAVRLYLLSLPGVKEGAA